MKLVEHAVSMAKAELGIEVMKLLNLHIPNPDFHYRLLFLVFLVVDGQSAHNWIQHPTCSFVHSFVIEALIINLIQPIHSFHPRLVLHFQR